MLSPPVDFAWLKQLHHNKRMRLTFGAGMAGCVHLNDSPEALVSELIRLAEIGQKIEIATGEKVRRAST
nr:hypothetical protein [uncultured Brevundimonas sp.]